MSSRRPLLKAAGLWSSSYDALQCFLLAKEVTGDIEVERMANLPEFMTIEDPELAPAAVTVDHIKILAAMGEQGRAELAARIRSRHAK
jgi:hypothetical protein